MGDIAIIHRDATKIRRGIQPKHVKYTFESVEEAKDEIVKEENPEDWTWIRLT